MKSPSLLFIVGLFTGVALAAVRRHMTAGKREDEDLQKFLAMLRPEKGR